MHTMLPRHTALPYSRARRAAQDLAVIQRRHLIHGLIEADVTIACAALRAHRQRTGETLSFTAFIVGCVARAVAEQRSVQAYRRGHRLIVFDDVDVTVLMEREVEGDPRVASHVVRAADAKSFRAIHDEIRAAQRAQLAPHRERVEVRLFDALPGPARRALIRLAGRSPSLWKHFGGTVAVTAVGMLGMGGGWGIPLTCNTLDVCVGGIGQRPSLVAGRVVMRAYLDLTISVDHDVVDGAPAARFASRLRELVEAGYGLEDLVAPAHAGAARAGAARNGGE